MKGSGSEYGGESLELLKKEVLSLKNHISRTLKTQLSDVKADFYYQSILKEKVFSDEYDFPVATITSWSVALELGCWLYETIIERRPKVVLEFGSGLSTLIMAIALNRSGGGKLIAVEHDEEYYKKTRDLLKNAGLLEYVELLLCPLVDLGINETVYKWYSLTETALESYVEESAIDLLLVDGPPAASGPNARFPAYHMTKRFLAEDALIVLDDADRSDEAAIVDQWVEESAGKLSAIRALSVRHGAAVLSAGPGLTGKQRQESEEQADSLDVSTPLTEELTALVRNRRISRELAANLIIRHQFHVERELSRNQSLQLEQASAIASARVNMALVIKGLHALEKVLSASEKQSSVSGAKSTQEIIGVELSNTYDFNLQSLTEALGKSEKYIGSLSEKAATILEGLFGKKNELEDKIFVLEKEKNEIYESNLVLENNNNNKIAEISEKNLLLSQALDIKERLNGDNERLKREVDALSDECSENIQVLKTLEIQYEAQTEEIRQLGHELFEVQEANKILDQENQDLAMELSEIKAANLRSAEELAMLKSRYNAQANEFAERELVLAKALDSLELLRQEHRAQCAEFDNEVADHSYSIAKLKKARRKNDAQVVELTLLRAELSEKAQQFEQQTQKNMEIESKLREINGVSRQMQLDNFRYSSSLIVESERAEKIKKHLSYRLGAAMIKNSGSVKGWLSMPWALKKAYKEFEGYKKEGAAESVRDIYFQTLSVKKEALIIALEPKWHEIYIDKSNVASQVKISLITVRNGASIGFEWLITDCDMAFNEKVERKCELTESKHLVLCDIDAKADKCLRIRKSRGVPAWLKIERIQSGLSNKSAITENSIKTISIDLISKIDTDAGRPGINDNPNVFRQTETIEEKVLISSSGKREIESKDAAVVAPPVFEKRTVLFDAYTLIENGEVARGFLYAKENANQAELHGISILEANESLNSDEKWLEAVNRYIGRLGIATIKLKEGEEDRFFRISTQDLAPIEHGALVSVIMPAYNCGPTLEFAANSVLQQQWKNLELIIVDDCSDDDTWQVMRKIAIHDPRVRILRNSVNCGPYVSKNRAVDIARGEYITGHDSDDWAHPERLARHMNAVLADPQPVYASAIKMIRLRSNGKFERISATTVNTIDGVMQTAFISTLFNTEFLRSKLGHWDCARFGADSEIISRCQALLGDRFIIYEQLGMLCLDSDDGLTAHPVHGTRGRTAPSRKHYKRAFLEWHEQLRIKGESYVLPFPHSPRKFPAPKAVTVSNADLQRIAREDKSGRIFDLDVCILTDLRYPGGTASSTLDELHTCLSMGLRVRVFHCPTSLSVGKPISSRYYPDVEHVEVQDFDVSKISAKVLIVRHPMVICSDAYAGLANRIKADSIVYVINNSRYRANGEDAFDLSQLKKALTLLTAAKGAKLYPLGPRIRKELESELLPIELAAEDWHPLFDSTYYDFQPKRNFSSPVVIGRHGRDQIDKWPSLKETLLKVYPADGSVNVKVLGGAGIVKKMLGRLPSNWTVIPFGVVEPPQFLRSLDVFVYFPSEGLNEAFGRTVMEAIFSGVPCILPESFRDSFGDLAFYSDANEVQAVISRLSEESEQRMEFVSAIRSIALENFDSKVLGKRLAKISSLGATDQTVEDLLINSSSWADMLKYKKWVERGYY